MDNGSRAGLTGVQDVVRALLTWAWTSISKSTVVGPRPTHHPVSTPENEAKIA
jgi:hypothetical protein